MLVESLGGGVGVRDLTEGKFCFPGFVTLIVCINSLFYLRPGDVLTPYIYTGYG
jgi:hypothetical protein